MPININMRSAANLVKGQGVGSCFDEQVSLVKKGLSTDYKITVNENVKADIIHYHTVNLSYFLERILKKKNTSGIGYVHFLPDTLDDSLKLPKVVRFVFYRYLLKFYNSMDYLVTVNPTIIAKLQNYKVCSPKILYIPNFVSEKDFFEQDKNLTLQTKKKYNIPNDKFVVLSAGQLQTRKGVVDFVKVAEKMPHIQFVWAGGFSFGKITDGYEEIMKIKENPPPNMKFLGIIDRSEMKDVYNMADLMFLPSFDELFPMTILEALCCKRPILLRDVVIYEDILFDYYLRGKTNEDFENIINKLDKDKVFYETWKDKAWECHQIYSEESILSKWEDLYNEAYQNVLSKSMKKDSVVFGIKK